MTLLRHPVVITSLEEDFRKIGLIKSDGRDEDDSFQEGLMESADDVEVDDDFEAEEDFDEDVEDAEEDVDNDALSEAVAFNESFAETWASLREDGIETIVLDESEMAEMEAMAEEVVELPAGVLPNVIDEDEDDDLDESEEDYDEDESGEEYEVDVDVEGDGTAFESVAEALRNVESLMEGSSVPSPEQAIPAFANMALIAEKLYSFFAETAEAQEDAEYAEISEAYRAIGKYSAGIVDTLQTEDPNTIDMDVLGETFKSYLGTILEGLETYAILREADDGEEYDEDEDEDEDVEYDEDDEGNA